MRRALWPDDDATASSLLAMIARSDYVAFVAEADGRLVGFAEIGVRSYAEGADGPAAYLEGIWVDDEWRRSGVATALADAGASWARDRGLAHFGSDALIDNEASRAWHHSVGFEEVERLVVFAKRIG
jgi:aminoglycoside 6'-N-acetyltransferase I